VVVEDWLALLRELVKEAAVVTAAGPTDGRMHCAKHFIGKRFFHSGLLRTFEPESSSSGYSVELPSSRAVRFN